MRPSADIPKFKTEWILGLRDCKDFVEVLCTDHRWLEPDRIVECDLAALKYGRKLNYSCGITTSVNVSLTTIQIAPNNWLEQAIRGGGLGGLIVEVCEQAPKAGFKSDELFADIARFCDKVKKMDGLIALDDFGDGVLPEKIENGVFPDIIKINFAHFTQLSQAWKALIEYAKSHQCKIVVERVETLHHLRALSDDLMITHAQGWFLLDHEHEQAEKPIQQPLRPPISTLTIRALCARP